MEKMAIVTKQTKKRSGNPPRVLVIAMNPGPYPYKLHLGHYNNAEPHLFPKVWSWSCIHLHFRWRPSERSVRWALWRPLEWPPVGHQPGSAGRTMESHGRRSCCSIDLPSTKTAASPWSCYSPNNENTLLTWFDMRVIIKRKISLDAVVRRSIRSDYANIAHLFVEHDIISWRSVIYHSSAVLESPQK